MKYKYFYYILLVIVAACSGDSGGEVIIKPPVDNPKPVAVNDTYNAVEDNVLIMSDLLTNDTVIATATITSIDASSSNNGTIVDNRNGTYSYNPPAGFVGEDTFKYTLCDRDSTPDCSTATVTITVNDEGSPVLTDDNFNGIANKTIILDQVLLNDNLIDDAVLTSIDNAASSGSAVINPDNTISYTPQTDFIGGDSFVYTVCDDDSPNPTCVNATVSITVLERVSFNIPANLSAYYQDLAFTADPNLNYDQLQSHTSEKHTVILSYAQRHDYLYDADEDASNTDNVILMYSGESRYWQEYTSGTNSYTPQTFNTEHIYPQSRLESDDAVTDLHHLRTCDDNVNSERSNFPFVDGSGTYGVSNEQWYPGDDWRGDVARMVMYLNVRYGETFEKVGSLELFLEWNAADPISAFELQRNAIIETAQGNRNPFIDNPYLATLIWGGVQAENKWE